MNVRSQILVSTGAVVVLLSALVVSLTQHGSAVWAPTVYAQETPSASQPADYVSPLELQLSPDGARLYILCQGSNEIRVLNASTFAVIKNIPVRAVSRSLPMAPAYS